MDAATLIQKVQHDYQVTQAELTNTRETLTNVVEEYTALERDFTDLEKANNVLREAFVTTTRIFFGSIRSLWDDLCSKGSAADNAQRSLTAALAHLDKTQRQLVQAGMGDVAAAAAVEGSEHLLAAAVNDTSDAVRREERELLVNALREVQAQVSQLEADLHLSKQAHVSAEARAEQLQHALAGGLGGVNVDGVHYDIRAVSDLRRMCGSLEAQVRELEGQVKQTRHEAAAAATQEATAVVNHQAEATIAALRVQLDSALRRVKDSEARAERLERDLGQASVTAGKRETELRGSIHSLEQANTALSRSLASVRLELEGLQDRHAAQSGVLDMMRQQLSAKDREVQAASAAKQAVTLKAAAALREVEGQVAQLTAAVTALQAQKKA